MSELEMKFWLLLLGVSWLVCIGPLLFAVTLGCSI